MVTKFTLPVDWANSERKLLVGLSNRFLIEDLQLEGLLLVLEENSDCSAVQGVCQLNIFSFLDKFPSLFPHHFYVHRFMLIIFVLFCTSVILNGAQCLKL